MRANCTPQNLLTINCFMFYDNQAECALFAYCSELLTSFPPRGFVGRKEV